MKKLLLALLFMPSILTANNLPINAKFETLTDFSGGLVTTLPSYKIANNYSPYMRNVFIDNGGVEGINGFIQVGSTGVLQQITGIFPYYLEDGRKYFLVTDSSVTLETSDFNSYTFVSSGSNTGALLNWMQVRNKMWGFNGVDPVMTWDHSVKTVLDGTNGTPDVPKFKYGAYYQDRVWGLGVPSAASDLRFSAAITTDNVIIAPDDARAWPSSYLLHVGQGDGQIATALWVYEGMLRVGKERSIYTIYGDDPTAYIPRKEESGNGVISNDSVVVMDGASHFVDADGIYKNTERISDLIEPDFNAINMGVTKIVTNVWETQEDFSKGQFQGSTASVDGLVYINSNSTGTEPSGIGYVNPAPPQPSGSHDITSGATYYGPIRVDFGGRISSSSVLIATSIVVGVSTTDPSMKSQLRVIVENYYTGVKVSTVAEPKAGLPAGYLKLEISSQSPVFEGWQINQGSFTVKWECAECEPSDVIRFSGLSSEFKDVKYFFVSATTGQYISEVSTVSSAITTWGNFNSVRQTNGGSINYYHRTATSVVNITTQTWDSVAPGANISDPLINRYVQWAATISAITAGNETAIDNVEISHIEGVGALTRPFAISWKNRYWLAVTTNSDSSMTMIYVKSKNSNTNPDAWMPIEGYNFRSFAKDGDTFYGGSASTGIIYRLDYGTSYDGLPIEYIYDTPDMVMGDYYFDKDIYKFIIDGEKHSGATMTLKYSKDFGDYTARTFSIDGTNRYSYVMEGVTGKAKTLRLRLTNSVLDQPFTINSLSVINGISGVLR